MAFRSHISIFEQTRNDTHHAHTLLGNTLHSFIYNISAIEEWKLLDLRESILFVWGFGNLMSRNCFFFCAPLFFGVLLSWC